MTQRSKTIPAGARVIDGHGAGTALGSTGLPPICDPRDWIWIDRDGERGRKVARIADLTITDTESAGKPATGAERIETARRVALAANVTLPGWTLADVARRHR